MSKPIDQCVKTIKHNETTVNHQEQEESVGVKENFSSTFVKQENVIVKAECNNPKSSSRSAVITLFDAKSNKLRGDYDVFICYLTVMGYSHSCLVISTHYVLSYLILKFYSDFIKFWETKKF